MIDELSLARERIRTLNVPVSTVAVCTGLTATEISLFLNGQRPCSAVKASKINRVMKQLEILVKRVAPLPLDFRRAVILKEILDLVEQGNLTPLVFKPDTPLSILSDEIPEISILIDLAQRRLEQEAQPVS